MNLVLLTLISFVVVLPAAAQGICEEDEFEVWTELENEWLGIWTRLDDSSEFAATFLRPGEEYEASLTIVIDEDNQVTIDRINPRTPGYYLQGDCVYEGELSDSESYASGTAVCEIEDGGGETDTFSWEATISCGSEELIGTEVTLADATGEPGRVTAFVCAPITTDNPLFTIWGTDVYTSDSSICTAALHAGVMTTAGGVVAVQSYAGLETYFPSRSNGVESLGYGAYPGSFTFFGLNAEPVLNWIGWGADAMPLRGTNGATYDYVCPYSDGIGPVWGSGIYSDDSSVCTAAVHAGLITLEEGGPVTILIVDGQEKYAASTQNGVASLSWDEWGGSFQFVDGGE